jgi:hypothetical protein
MKTMLVFAAAMGFSVSFAAAECAGHAKMTTTSVDTETTVASVAKQLPPPAQQPAEAEEAAETE